MCLNHIATLASVNDAGSEDVSSIPAALKQTEPHRNLEPVFQVIATLALWCLHAQAAPTKQHRLVQDDAMIRKQAELHWTEYQSWTFPEDVYSNFHPRDVDSLMDDSLCRSWNPARNEDRHSERCWRVKPFRQLERFLAKENIGGLFA